MAENPAAKFSTALDAVIATRDQKTAPELKGAVVSASDVLWRDSWDYHCTHMDKHLDAIAATSSDPETQIRIGVLKGVLARMRDEGMPAINAITDKEGSLSG